MPEKIRYEYGMRKREISANSPMASRLEPLIVKHTLRFIKDQFKTTGLQYILGEIYRRPAGSNEPWERCD